MKELKDFVRSIPDFPEKGIMFRDVSTVLQDKDGFKLRLGIYARTNWYSVVFPSIQGYNLTIGFTPVFLLLVLISILIAEV